MDLRDLTYLHSIIDKGSVVAAADALGRTPPALTKAMRRLEEVVGSPLFTKSGRGIEPTAAAIFLASQTRGIGKHLARIRGDVHHLAEGRRGLVRLGVSATMAAIYLPQLMRRLSVDLPDLRIMLVNGMNDVFRQALRNGDLDAVLGVYDEDDPDMQGFPIARDEVCVVAAVGHPLQGRRIGVEELVGRRWVLPSRAVTMRQWLDAAFISRSLPPPEPHVEATSIAILETLIADSDFLSFVSSWKVGNRLSRNQLAALDVPELRMPRKFGLLWSATTPPGPATAELIRYIRSALDPEVAE